MDISEVTAYKTKDGRVFATKGEAETHQAICDFEEWYEDNKIYGEYYVSSDDLLRWLGDHQGDLIELLPRILQRIPNVQG